MKQRRLKLPFDLIEDRRTIVLILCLLLGGNILFYAFIARPLGDRGEALSSAARDYEKENRRLQQSGKSIQLLDAQVQALQESLTQFHEEVLGEKRVNMRPILKGIRSFAQKNQMIIESISYSHDFEEESTLVAFAIRFSLEGSYEHLKGFIQDVENADHFLIIESIALRTQSSAVRASIGRTEKLSLNIGIVTYFQPEPGPMEAKGQISSYSASRSERHNG